MNKGRSPEVSISRDISRRPEPAIPLNSSSTQDAKRSDPILRRRLTTTRHVNSSSSSVKSPKIADGEFELYIESLADQLQDAMREESVEETEPESIFDPLRYDTTPDVSNVKHQELAVVRASVPTSKTERRRSTFSKWSANLFRRSGTVEGKTMSHSSNKSPNLQISQSPPRASHSVQQATMIVNGSEDYETSKAGLLLPSKPVANGKTHSPRDHLVSPSHAEIETQGSQAQKNQHIVATLATNEALELETFIPEHEQPPTMLATWGSSRNATPDLVLTDRFGFKLFDARTKQKKAKTESFDEAYEIPFDPSIPDILHTSDEETESMPSGDTVPTPESRSLTSQDERLHDSSFKIDRSPAKHNYNSFTSIATTPRPLSPETTLNKPSAVLQQNDNESSSAKLYLMSQIDVKGADKAKEDAWDNFIRRLRDDRKKTDSKQNDWVEHQEMNLAGLGTNHVGKDKAKELNTMVYAGIPIRLRPRLWAELTGAYSLKTPLYYSELLSPSASSLGNAACVDQIDLDIKRTMPSNLYFAGTGVGVGKLRRVLLAFSRHNTAVGYCQGMNNIAATLLLTYPIEDDAFFALTAIVENILPTSYFTVDLLTSRADQIVLKTFVRGLCPKIDKHLKKLSIDLEAITFGWFLSIFTDCLPAEWLFRIWDVFFIEGHPYLFCVAIAILRIHEKAILNSEHPGAVYTILKELTRTSELKVDHFIILTEQIRQSTKASDRYNITSLQAAAIKELQSSGN